MNSENNKINIAVTSTSFSNNVFLKDALLQLSSAVHYNCTGEALHGASFINFIQDSDAIIVGLERIDEAVLVQCPKLQIISKFGVGLDNIDLHACERKGIKVGWTGGVNRLSVAELVLGFMLALCRNYFITSTELKNGQWRKNGGFQLSGKTIGIIGVGNIGKEVIRLLEPFQCTILVNDIIEQNMYYLNKGLIEATKDEIFKQADIISLHTPLTEITRFMVNHDTLSLMKKSAVIINTARGAIVNSNDLKIALQNGRISGAALDVYEIEPPDDFSLLQLPNIICTPHIGGNANEAVLAMGMSAIKHIKEFFNL